MIHNNHSLLIVGGREAQDQGCHRWLGEVYFSIPKMVEGIRSFHRPVLKGKYY